MLDADNAFRVTGKREKQRETNEAAAAAVKGAAGHKAKPGADKAQLEAEIKKLESEVKKKKEASQHANRKDAVAAPAPAPPPSWSGLANMLDSTTSDEQAAEKAQQRLLAQSDDADDDRADDAKLANYLSDPEDDLASHASPDGPTALPFDASSNTDFNSLFTTLKKDEDPAAAATENMYRRAEEAAVNTLHPVKEVYSSQPVMSVEEPVQQLHTVPVEQMHRAGSDSLATKMQLLRAEVKRYKEQQEVKKLEKEVASFKTKHPADTQLHHTSLGLDESKYLKEDKKAAEQQQPAAPPAKAPAHKDSSGDVKESRLRQEKVDEKFEAAREHLAVHDADSSEEDVARLRAEVDVMRARIKTLEKKEGVKGSDKLLELPEDTDVTHSEALRSGARQQLLAQLRRSALNAGTSGDDFWKRQAARQAAAKFRMEALNAGAKSFDQVEQLKSALQQQKEKTRRLQQELSEQGRYSALPVPSPAEASLAVRWQASSLQPAAGLEGASSSWEQGLAEVRREMSGVRKDMDETAGREDAIVGRISELGNKIGGFVRGADVHDRK
jgi:hypothetical protein